MPDYVSLSRDPFARSNLVRRIVKTTMPCQNCGCVRTRLPNHPERPAYRPLGSLFQYGSIRDDRARVEWHGGYFCSKSCHDAFHGS